MQRSSTGTLIGASDYFNGDGDDNIIGGPGDWGTTFNAPNSNISLNSALNRVNWTVNSSGDKINASNTDGWITAGQNDILNGQGNVVTLADNVTIRDLQYHNDFKLANNDNMIVSTDVIGVGAGRLVHVEGEGDTINGTDNDVFYISDPGNAPADIVNIVNARHATVNVLPNSRAVINGDNVTICVGAGAQVTINGRNDPIVHDPVIVQFGQGNVETTRLAGSAVYADVLGNGQVVHTAWMTAGEGMLVDDPASTNQASAATLITGFDQMQGLDSNHDGILSAGDAAWRDVKLFLGNPDGSYDPANLKTLDQVGIKQIDLHSTASNTNDHGNVIFDTSRVTWDDGHTTEAASVGLALEPVASSVDPLTAPIENSLTAIPASHDLILGDESYVSTSQLFGQAAPEVSAPASYDSDAVTLLGAPSGAAFEQPTNATADYGSAQQLLGPADPIRSYYASGQSSHMIL